VDWIYVLEDGIPKNIYW